MLIYKDILTGDELISDAYDLKLVDGAAYEADCAMITEGGLEINIGANASAEEAAEDLEDTSVKVNNVVSSFRLQSTSFDKKNYKTYVVDYIKRVVKEIEKIAKEKADEATSESEKESILSKSKEEVTAFKSGAQAYLKDKILPNFKDFEFYTGESMNPEGMVVLLNYREDGVTPYVVIWKLGAQEHKY